MTTALMRSPPRVPSPMQPTPIVLPGDGAERTVGANVETAAIAVAAWPVVRRNRRRFKVVASLMDSGLSVVFSNYQ